MANKITHTHVYVLDQDEALDFYVGKLGFELNTDADLGFMRWLTVNFPGQEHQLLLEKPGPPVHDEVTAEQIRELVTKGALGMVAIRPTQSSWHRESSSRRSPPSASTAPTAACGTRSATRSGSARPKRARSRCPIRAAFPRPTGPDPNRVEIGEARSGGLRRRLG